jgi:hypothetical protein
MDETKRLTVLQTVSAVRDVLRRAKAADMMRTAELLGRCTVLLDYAIGELDTPAIFPTYHAELEGIDVMFDVDSDGDDVRVSLGNIDVTEAIEREAPVFWQAALSEIESVQEQERTLFDTREEHDEYYGRRTQ